MTIEEISAKELAIVLSSAIDMRRRAWELDQESKSLKLDADNIFRKYGDDLGTDKLDKPGTGSITFIDTARNKFDREAFNLRLAMDGVDPDLIRRAEASATSTTVSRSYKFTAGKEGA